jgi:hypothetical protein
MPAKPKKSRPTTRSRVPEGKAQMLSILDKEVIRDVKVAAAQDERKVSHVVEEALRAWLAQRGRKQP